MDLTDNKIYFYLCSPDFNMSEHISVNKSNLDRSGWIGDVPVIDTSVYKNQRVAKHLGDWVWYENEGPMRGSRVGISHRLMGKSVYKYYYYLGEKIGKRLYYKQTLTKSPVVVIKGNVYNKVPRLNVHQVLKSFKDAILESYTSEIFKRDPVKYKRFSSEKVELRRNVEIMLEDDSIFLVKKESFENDLEENVYWKLLRKLIENVSMENGVTSPVGYSIENKIPAKEVSKPVSPLIGSTVKVIKPELRTYEKVGIISELTKRGYLVQFGEYPHIKSINLAKDSVKIISMKPQIGDKIRVTGKHLGTYGSTGVIKNELVNDTYEVHLTYDKPKKNGMTCTTIPLRRTNFTLVK